MAQRVSTGPFASLVRAYAENQTTTGGFPADACLATTPPVDDVADGLFVWTPELHTQRPPIALLVIPFGEGNENDTFDVLVTLYHRTARSRLYVPSGVCQFTATLGALAGLSGHDVSDTERFCKSVSAPVVGVAGVDCQPLATAAGRAAGYLVDMRAAHLAVLHLNRGTAAATNALVGTVSRIGWPGV